MTVIRRVSKKADAIRSHPYNVRRCATDLEALYEHKSRPQTRSCFLHTLRIFVGVQHLARLSRDGAPVTLLTDLSKIPFLMSVIKCCSDI